MEGKQLLRGKIKKSIRTGNFTYGGMQQVGIGVHDLKNSEKFYREVLGFDIPMFDEDGEANLMLPYTGGRGWKRHAMLLANLHGGAALEVWQHTERTPQVLANEAGLTNLGILCPYLRCVGIENVREQIIKTAKTEVSKIALLPDGTKRFYVRDIEYNWIGLVETKEGWFSQQKKISSAFDKETLQRENIIGGVCGVLVSVSNMNNSLEFYTQVCGYDTIVYDKTAVFEDLNAFRGQQSIRRVMLKRNAKNKGVFAHLLKSSFIELIQLENTKNQEGHVYGDYTKRFWGDPGYIHLCFDVKEMDNLKAHCALQGHEFSVDTGAAQEFEMDEAAGRFAYLEDPDKTLIEFVEVYTLPLIKKFKLILNVRKRKSPLPKILIALFALKRK